MIVEVIEMSLTKCPFTKSAATCHAQICGCSSFFVDALLVIRQKNCARAQFSGCSSTTKAYNKEGRKTMMLVLPQLTKVKQAATSASAVCKTRARHLNDCWGDTVEDHSS